MESDILQQARELAEKIDNGTLSKEEVAAVLSKTPAQRIQQASTNLQQIFEELVLWR